VASQLTITQYFIDYDCSLSTIASSPGPPATFAEPMASNLGDMRCATVAVLVMIAGVGRSSERITDHWITETTLFRGFAIPAPEFSKARVKNLVTRLFAASGRKLVVVRAKPDGPGSDHMAMATNNDDHFKIWRDQYEWMVDYTRVLCLVCGRDGLR